MSSKKFMLLLGVCLLMAGCASTGNYSASGYEMGGSATDKGVRYLLGRGVPQNSQKAFYYFNQAAKEDDPFAQNELGYMYAAGKGTEKDYVKSFVYYQKAANHGLASAQYNLGLIYARGLGTPRSRELALAWFKKSAAHGFEPAKLMLEQYRS